MSATTTALGAERLGELLRDQPFVTRLVVLERVVSTNDELRRLSDEGADEGTVVVANTQSGGRGRVGRVWYSPPGVGLYLSVLFRPRRPLGEMVLWNLSAALAACEACRSLSGAEVQLDWPNDLVHGGRKLGGVLAELRSTAARAGDLIIGTGLNLDQRPADFDDDLDGRATSLRIAAGEQTRIDREKLAAEYLRRVAELSERLQRGEWTEIRRRWERLAPAARGSVVRVIPASAKYEPGLPGGIVGCTDGLDDSGALRVRGPDGSVVLVRGSESVVPVEG